MSSLRSQVTPKTRQSKVEVGTHTSCSTRSYRTRRHKPSTPSAGKGANTYFRATRKPDVESVHAVAERSLLLWSARLVPNKKRRHCDEVAEEADQRWPAARLRNSGFMRTELGLRVRTHHLDRRVSAIAARFSVHNGRLQHSPTRQ
ncbi:hypothetical protein MRX96_050665 [Rhipicephalus microplus]